MLNMRATTIQGHQDQEALFVEHWYSPHFEPFDSWILAFVGYFLIETAIENHEPVTMLAVDC